MNFGTFFLCTALWDLKSSQHLCSSLCLHNEPESQDHARRLVSISVLEEKEKKESVCFLDASVRVQLCSTLITDLGEILL